jgi:mxaC protein
MNFDQPWLLWLLPLALLPLLRQPGQPMANGWLALAPRDALSTFVGHALRALAALAIAALVISIAGPHRPEYFAPRIGKGAEIVLLLDRSRSMDQGFAGALRHVEVHHLGSVGAAVARRVHLAAA